MLIKHRVSGFVNKVLESPAGLWFPGLDFVVPKHQNILAVRTRERAGFAVEKLMIPGSNLVSDAGDLYYAQLGAEEASTNAFGVHEMQTATTGLIKAANRSDFTAIASSEKAHTATYPKTNDGDADNTGAGTDIVTYLVSYLKADFNDAAITHGIITNITPGASEPILTGYAFAASFAKTADDSLKVFVNHEMLGA